MNKYPRPRAFNTQDKYVKIQRQKAENQENDEHEIRINSKKKAGNYIARAKVLFLEKKFDYVVLNAAGAAISTLCIAADIIRRRIKGLHQISKLTNAEIIDEYEPIEEGLINVKVTRQLSVLEIKLTKNVTEEEKKSYGYSEPLPEKEIVEEILNIDRIKTGQKRGDDRDYKDDRGYKGERGVRRGSRLNRRGRGRGKPEDRQQREDEYDRGEDMEKNRERRDRGNYQRRLNRGFRRGERGSRGGREGGGSRNQYYDDGYYNNRGYDDDQQYRKDDDQYHQRGSMKYRGGNRERGDREEREERGGERGDRGERGGYSGRGQRRGGRVISRRMTRGGDRR